MDVAANGARTASVRSPERDRARPARFNTTRFPGMPGPTGRSLDGAVNNGHAHARTNGNSPLVTVTEVVHAAPRDEFLRLHLDSPGTGGAEDVYALRFEGWLMTQDVPPVAVEITRPGVLISRIPLSVPRPDLARIYPDIPWAVSKSGFRASVNLLQAPTKFELQVEVVLQNEKRISVATVRGRRRAVPTTSGGLQPLFLSTLGRSGSTWATKLLSSHPAIVAYPPFRSEAKVSSYWAEVFLALSEPSSYRQSVDALISTDDWWLGNGYVFGNGLDDQLLAWLGHDHVEELMSFCKGRIEAFYEGLAAQENGTPPRYFAEKRLPHVHATLALLDMFPGTRELFLVRDLRDMVCSIFAYNEKRGFPYFNRDRASSDEDYVRTYLAPGVDALLADWRQRAESARLLRYEDLVLHPEQTLEEVLSYLDLENSPEDIRLMIERERATSSSGQRRHQTVSSPRESVGRWRTDLPTHLQTACEETFGEALSAFGYEI